MNHTPEKTPRSGLPIGKVLLSVVLGAAALLGVWPIIRWLFVDAAFWPPEATACLREVAGEDELVSVAGACWPAVWDTLPLLLVGRYPQEEVWRIGLAALVFLAGVFVFARWKGPMLGRALALAGSMLFSLLLFRGAEFLGLAVVPSTEWGGLALTLVLSIGGIGAGFPLGLVMALGRRSSLPVIRWVSTTYIELIRGVPLITLLFMANYLFPLVLPPNSVSIDALLRAQIAIILFQGAYIAEVVRGGLQAVPSGQYEAAQALGMSYAKMMRLVVLPQALRISVPALVSTFIGLIKDTSLVAVIGIFDLLGTARNVPSIPEWVGRDFEPLVFSALIYFVICYGLSRFSRAYENVAIAR